MFYSQFILAKKGPLGTIWIAAHLERKLRKNQVADTDIGVSVDSILFPEVPIALRLSSHLLLGVVRIYSRKVNYLFDDCSEALLKVKQAFRSTAVDLPPEESTAPYHSITLPETFDLDDFELPDNEILQGNYVDHHVSAREQITLQDAMDGVVYSTSQFGLDERFGDGDTSQLNLDLDEEVFHDKDAATGIEGVSIADGDGSVDATTVLTEDATATAGVSEAMLADVSENQAEDLDGNTEFNEYAQAPQTPGVVDVPNQSSIRELACDDHMEVEAHNVSECIGAEEFKTASSELDMHQKGITAEYLPTENNLNHDSGTNITPHEIAEVEIQSNPGGRSPVSVVAGENLMVDEKADEQNELEKQEHPHVDSPCCSHVTAELEDPGRLPVVVSEKPVCQEPKDPVAPTEMQGDECHVTDVNQETDSSLRGEADSRRLDVVSVNLLTSDNQLENLTGLVGSDLPAPEKLLSVPEGHAEKDNDFMVESTPDKEDLPSSNGDAGTKNISGKKRTFTESTLTAESLNSVESVGLILSRRTADSIPDDDDLLSSILVGRSSFLKMKPTPVLEVASTKRLRSAPRSTASKRKIVMDDPMVLHGDIIRQQLMNAEDIRRVRKKAPCSHPEILMIHRQFLEDELFKEPIFAGMSVELVSLHSESYDLKEIRIVEGDEHHGASKDNECSVRPDVQEQPSETPIHQLDQQSEDHHNQGQTMDKVQKLQNDLLDEKFAVEVDKGNAEVNNSSLQEEICEMPTGEKNDIAGDVQAADGELENREGKIDGQVIEDASVVDISNKSGSGPIEVSEVDVEDIVPNEMDMKAEDMLLPDEQKIDLSVEIREVEVDGSTPCDNANDSLADASAEAGILDNLAFVNGNEVIREANNDLDRSEELESDNINLACNGVSNEEDRIGSTCPEPDEIENPITEEVANDVGVHSQDGFAGDDNVEMEGLAVEHDTEFLNFGDDEVAEDDDDEGVPYGDETRVLENSGWSSRTRAVSKYLQTLFDKESEHGKKVLSVDNLLVGKTRKEASRMFFETLVLKTKDYIQVEQAMPFDSINVKPRAKLMKSIF